jgi:predicted flap endonuclease-1-like 5' DNA nuclease
MEVLGIIAGISIVVLAPSIPVLRDVTKIVVKGGIAASEAVKGIASATAKTYTELAEGVRTKEAEKAAATKVGKPKDDFADDTQRKTAKTTRRLPESVAVEVGASAPAAISETSPETPKAVSESAEAPPEPATKSAGVDDLTRIKGIGPKIAGILNEVGIETYAALATTDAAQLQAALDAAGPRYSRLADPASWVAQAEELRTGD